MTRKLFTLMAVFMITAMILAACAPAATPTEAPPAETEAPVETVEPVETEEPAAAFRVGFVTDTGGIDDKSFNTTQWNGVLKAEAELGVASQFIQSDEASQYEPNLTEFASQGYDLVIASGFFLGGDLAKVAAQYPDVNFTIVDYAYPDPFGVPEGVVGNAECIPNVQGQVFKTDQAAFLAGYLAAGMTKTGKIGYFGGAKIPTVTIFGVGFQAGMEHYNEVHGAEVELVGWDNETGEGLFTGDFADLTKGKEATESLFDEGADIFIPVGGLIGSPGFDVARERGGYGIWVDVDGFNLLPEASDVMLTSVMKNMDNSVYDVIKDTMDGNFKGCDVYIGDLANAGVGIAQYHDLVDAVPAELQEEVAELSGMIISGEIEDTGCLSYPQHCPGGLYEVAAVEPAEPTSDIGTADNPIKVLFVPSVDAAEIVAGGEQLAGVLNEATSLEFEVSVPTSYAATIEEMCASPGNTMGFIPGLGYVLANQLCGVEVAAKAVRFGYDWYAAMLMVERDSELQSVEELAGLKWAYPDPGSTSGYMYPLYMLQQAGVELGETLEAGSHDGAVRAIYNGEADFGTAFYSPPRVDGVAIEWLPGDPPDVPEDLLAECNITDDGGTIMCGNFEPRDARRNLREEAPDVMQKVRILDVTTKIPNDTISFGPEFPADLRDSIVAALFAFAESDPEGFATAMDPYSWTGINVAIDEDYDPIRVAVEAAGFTLEDLGE